MMMKTKLLLAALCGLLCAGGCREKPDDWPLLSLNSEEILAYTAFQKGSWWVYETKDKKGRDSLYVTAYKREIQSDKQAKMRWETSTTFYGSDGGPFRIIVRPLGYGDAARHCCDADYTTLVLPVNNAKGIFGDEEFGMEGPIETVKVRGMEFHKVYKAIHRKQFHSGSEVHEEYFAPNVGMIKRVDFDSTEWNLVKYHINK